MKINLPILQPQLLGLFVLFSFSVTTNPALALDPACEPFLKSCEARTKIPAWHSITELNSNFKMESIKAGGQFYMRRNDEPWSKSPVNIDEVERKMLQDIRSGSIKLDNCKNEGSQTIDGVDTTIISYKMEMPGAPAQSAKLFIGKSDGLPYSLTSETTKSKYKYINITAPKL